MSGDDGARGLADTLRREMLLRQAEVTAANNSAATWARVWREEVNAHGQHGRPSRRYKRAFRCAARKRARAAHRAHDTALSRWRAELRRVMDMAANTWTHPIKQADARIVVTFGEAKS